MTLSNLPPNYNSILNIIFRHRYTKIQTMHQQKKPNNNYLTYKPSIYIKFLFVGFIICDFGVLCPHYQN